MADQHNKAPLTLDEARKVARDVDRQADEGGDFSSSLDYVMAGAMALAAKQRDLAAQAQPPVSQPLSDVLNDALDNLLHDNYERSYSGSRNREADVSLIRAALAQQPGGQAQQDAGSLREPKNGSGWRVEWWNESMRLMLPNGYRIESHQHYRNGTMQLTIKRVDAARQGQGDGNA